MNTRSLLIATLTFAAFTPGCMIGPEHGDWIPSIFDDVTFNVLSPWEGADYQIDTALLDANDQVISWHGLTVGTTDSFLFTDVDGRDIYYDVVKTPILIGWTDAPGPGCGNIDPECHYKVRIRTQVRAPSGTVFPAYTFDNGTVGCRNSAAVAGGADKVITDCARQEQWIELNAFGE